MPVGIEKLDLYAGRFYLDLADLAHARNADGHRLATDLMCESRSVYPPYEDAVTIAVNAARRVLSPEDIANIELVIVGTESGVDFGKPISTWVHRFCELPPNARTFEIKHACYGTTGALSMALSWVATAARPGKKALVINTDFSRAHFDSPAELICGGCGVAMLVSANPEMLEIDPAQTGYWTTEVPDTFRPTAHAEIGNNQVSLFSYLDALEGAYRHYRQRVGDVDYDRDFRKHIYHAPFPGMTRRAHRSMMQRVGIVDRAALEASFQQKVAGGLSFARRIGSAYGGSTFVSLLGLLHDEGLRPGDPISLFAYGSGCQGEFYAGSVGAQAIERGRARNIAAHLDERARIDVAEYEETERLRARDVDSPSSVPDRRCPSGGYERLYAGRQLLVLRQVENYYRTYEWS